MKIITCICCGEETAKRTKGHQKYCPACSELKDIERKKRWAQANGRKYEYDPEKQKVRNANQRSKAIENGIKISNENRNSITWPADIDDDLDMIIRVAVPFEYGFSKNAAWSFAKKGHVFLKENHRNLREMLAYSIKQASKNVNWYEDRVWIDIFVQKPNHKGDAINVVDGVCDAVKVAIGIDDRWFSIRKLDWEIVKENPMLYVGIGQKSDEDKRVCSLCGRILPLGMFTKNSRDKLGRSRECQECSRVRDAEKRKRIKNKSIGGYEHEIDDKQITLK